jgi:hypothetical protein
LYPEHQLPVLQWRGWGHFNGFNAGTPRKFPLTKERFTWKCLLM